MQSSSVKIRTAKASGYLQQMCKHFGHKLESEFTPETGWIQFAFGRAELLAGADELTMKATAEQDEDLARLQNVLASHLERFAFREDLTIDWTN